MIDILFFKYLTSPCLDIFISHNNSCLKYSLCTFSAPEDLSELLQQHGIEEDTMQTLWWEGFHTRSALVNLTPDKLSGLNLSLGQQKSLEGVIAELKLVVKTRYGHI